MRKGSGLPPLLTTSLFQGLTEPQFARLCDAITESAQPGCTGGPAIPQAESQGVFNGTPYADMTMSLTLLNARELKLDGIIDLSELLGVPQGRVDLVVSYDELERDSDNPPASGCTAAQPERS